MNKIYKFLIVSTVFLSLTVAGTVKATDSFEVSLKYGDRGEEVVKLQTFLVNQGFLVANLITGNFLTLTQKAVMAFQVNSGIDPVGIFGPLSRAVANLKYGVAQTQKSTIGAVGVAAKSNIAGALTSNAKEITWQTSGYPTGAGIDINLLRKTSSNPNSYTLVEKIAKDTPNDGSETWVPKSNQTGSDLYIEVTCSTTRQFDGGCSVASGPFKAF